MTSEEIRRLKYFSPEKDPKIDFNRCDRAAIKMLESAREMANTPFRITSHYRTPEHSVSVGGSPTDAHTKDPCTAFDIAYSGGQELFSIVQSVLWAGFRRIGINAKNYHVHVDNDPGLPTPRIWIE